MSGLTVAQVIERLSTYPADVPVIVETMCCGCSEPVVEVGDYDDATSVFLLGDKYRHNE